MLSISGRHPRTYPQKPLRELFQPLVSVLLRLLQNPLHQSPELRLTPVITGRRFGARGVSEVSALQQRADRRQVETGIIPWGKGKAGRIAGTGILIDKGSRHAAV